jgi:hypothetical protein
MKTNSKKTEKKRWEYMELSSYPSSMELVRNAGLNGWEMVTLRDELDGTITFYFKREL